MREFPRSHSAKWAFGLGALALGAADASPAGAAAWNELQGEGLVIVRGTYDTGSTSFDKKGHLIKTQRYTKREASTYIEYGLTNWLEVIAKPDFVSTTLAGSPGGRYTGFGTSELGAQARLLAFGPAILAVQGTFQLPATSRESNLALIGNTARNTDARALLGVGFALGSWPSFLDAEAGYRMRSAHAPDEVHVDLTVGTRPRPDILLLVQSFTTLPTSPGVPFFPRSSYSNMEVSGVYDINLHWSAQLGVFTTIDGRDALRERGTDVSLWYRF